MKTEFHILNLGAGVQSTALYLMFMRGDLPMKLDCAIFADTQDEPRAVYDHLQWLRSLGGPPILIVTKGKLSDHLRHGINSTGQRFASIPAFTLRPDGTEGKVRRQCSSEYKIIPIQQAIRRQVLGLEKERTPKRGVVVHQYIGICLDEAGRAQRIRAVKRAKYLRVHFPLIDSNITRAGCQKYLAPIVPHETPRSACVYCPFHNDVEWERQQREDPKSFAISAEVDHMLRVPGNVVNRQLNQQLFLHRSCVPLDLLQFDPKPKSALAVQTNLNFNQECMGVCGV